MRKKQYGSYQVKHCPFCSRQATTKNAQKVPVCTDHRAASLADMKCSCGAYLDILEGKYGAYARCISCGPMNLEKAFAMSPPKMGEKEEFVKQDYSPRLPQKKLKAPDRPLTPEEVDIYYS